jgi:hypothetical protein
VPRRPPKSLRATAAHDLQARYGITPQGDDEPSTPLGGRQTQHTPDGDYLVRSVPGSAARKPYRCPGCQQVIAAGAAHVVAWPAEDPSWLQSSADSRRHWHGSCWRRWSTRGGPPRR